LKAIFLEELDSSGDDTAFQSYLASEVDGVIEKFKAFTRASYNNRYEGVFRKLEIPETVAAWFMKLSE
jgi:hypothetical protein